MRAACAAAAATKCSLDAYPWRPDFLLFILGRVSRSIHRSFGVRWQPECGGGRKKPVQKRTGLELQLPASTAPAPPPRGRARSSPGLKAARAPLGRVAAEPAFPAASWAEWESGGVFPFASL